MGRMKVRIVGIQHPNSPGVEFRDIPGFSDYHAGGDGSIWSCRGRKINADGSKRWKRLRGYPSKVDGRLAFMLIGDDGKPKPAQCAVFIALAFHGPCPNGMECCHNDGNCQNNIPSNLRWDTRTNNMVDRIQHGTQATKLNEDAVREIRRIRGPQRALAAKYGVNLGLINRILKNKRWAHVV